MDAIAGADWYSMLYTPIPHLVTEPHLQIDPSDVKKGRIDTLVWCQLGIVEESHLQLLEHFPGSFTAVDLVTSISSGP